MRLERNNHDTQSLTYSLTILIVMAFILSLRLILRNLQTSTYSDISYIYIYAPLLLLWKDITSSSKFPLKICFSNSSIFSYPIEPRNADTFAVTELHKIEYLSSLLEKQCNKFWKMYKLVVYNLVLDCENLISVWK